jgi:hypothetical protein
MDRLGRAVWELLHSNPEIGFVRAEIYVGRGDDPRILATDVAGGVVWIDVAGDNDRQVIMPDGNPARDEAWLAKRRREGPAPE